MLRVVLKYTTQLYHRMKIPGGFLTSYVTALWPVCTKKIGVLFYYLIIFKHFGRNKFSIFGFVVK